MCGSLLDLVRCRCAQRARNFFGDATRCRGLGTLLVLVALGALALASATAPPPCAWIARAAVGGHNGIAASCVLHIVLSLIRLRTPLGPRGLGGPSPSRVPLHLRLARESRGRQWGRRSGIATSCVQVLSLRACERPLVLVALGGPRPRECHCTSSLRVGRAGGGGEA
jgi:hypothetical protein